MDKIDMLNQRLQSIKEKLKITEMVDNNMDRSFDEWVSKLVNNKLLKKGWGKDEKQI